MSDEARAGYDLQFRQRFFLSDNQRIDVFWRIACSSFLATVSSQDYSLRIQIVIKGIVASATYSVLTPIPVRRNLALFSSRGGLQEGICRLGRVTATVSYSSIFLWPNRFEQLGFQLQRTSLRTFRKGGDSYTHGKYYQTQH